MAQVLILKTMLIYSVWFITKMTLVWMLLEYLRQLGKVREVVMALGQFLSQLQDVPLLEIISIFRILMISTSFVKVIN